ncbi:kinase-like domain-containing protein [Rhizophagus clarus]|uniref:Kinase-like domain-containing protein n=1 Tax=Rhizophagus clarus TaxID=94130 RepID=A0A8H3QYE6_9GLOM|nr:kinase-like domain-containing protein [Rhizophagus clarus]
MKWKEKLNILLHINIAYGLRVIHEKGLIHHDFIVDFFLVMVLLMMSSLVIKICQGLRPKSNYEIPQLMLNINNQCWDANPLKRPKTGELVDVICNLYIKNLPAPKNDIDNKVHL